MSRLLVATIATALTAALGACGDSTAPAVNRNEPGTGTHTLRVEGEIEGQDVAGGFTTQMVVKVRDAAGNAVSGATVAVRNSTLGTLNLLELSAGSGEYEASVNTFASGDYRLDVVRGTDKVEDVVIGGMAAHAITSPTLSAPVAADQPLTVTWSRPSEAAGADLETRDFSADGIPDAGSYTVPAADNPARTDQRIRVWRYNEVALAGGLLGSKLKLSIRNTLEPVVVQ